VFLAAHAQWRRMRNIAPPDAGFPGIGDDRIPCFLRWREVSDTYSASHPLLAYQHLAREGRDAFIERIADKALSHTAFDTRSLAAPRSGGKALDLPNFIRPIASTTIVYAEPRD
jgi:hypothetical protein